MIELVVKLKFQHIQDWNKLARLIRTSGLCFGYEVIPWQEMEDMEKAAEALRDQEKKGVIKRRRKRSVKRKRG